jgi:hypothetical protein
MSARVKLDVYLCEGSEEYFEHVSEGGFADDAAERLEDVLELFFDDDLDENLDAFECLLARVGVLEMLPL